MIPEGSLPYSQKPSAISNPERIRNNQCFVGCFNYLYQVAKPNVQEVFLK
jgi:hypothetical protein